MGRAKTFGYYMEYGIGSIKCPTSRRNYEKLSKHQFSERVNNQVISTHCFRFNPPDTINEDTIAEWLKTTKSKLRLLSIKESENGNPAISELINDLRTTYKKTDTFKVTTMLKNPDTYNNIREARREMDRAIRHLLKANKEFIPKESE